MDTDRRDSRAGVTESKRQASAIDLYRKQYVDLQFERAGLFHAIRQKYGATDVLYPGSSIHITPSFFFPHVVYVDPSPLAEAFFADREGIMAYIDGNKSYRRSAHVRFLPQDCRTALPLLEGSFDLLISLFAGGISASCGKYVKPGGLLLADNHHGEAQQAASAGPFELISVIRYAKHAYSILERGLDGVPSGKETSRTKQYLKRASQGLVYVENVEYYVFRKRPPRRSA